MAVAGVGHAGRAGGRAPVPPRGVAEPAARRGDHGHADLDRHARGVRLVAVRPVPRSCRRPRHDDAVHPPRHSGQRRGQHLPRGRRGGDDVHPGRAVLRGTGQTPGRRGVALPTGAGGEGRRGPARRAGAAGPGRPSRCRRPFRRPARREDRHRRGGRGRRLRGRREHAHRRITTGRSHGGRRGHRCHAERQRPAAGPGDPGRCGHPARADGEARRRRAKRQGRGSTAG